MAAQNHTALPDDFSEPESYEPVWLPVEKEWLWANTGETL